MRNSFLKLIGSVIFMLVFTFISTAYTPLLAEGEHFNNLIQGRNSITGFVFANGRKPVPDVYVELETDTYSLVSRVKTSGSGFYSFRGLSQGNYKVKILTYGTDYEEQTQSVSLVGISALPNSGSVSEQVDFYLRSKKITNSNPMAAPGVIYAQEVPDSAKKLYEQGVSDLINKNEKEGFEKLKKSIEIFPNYFLALDRLGSEYVLRGYYRPAYILLTKALEINSRSFSSMLGLGIAQYKLEQYGAAVEMLNRAVKQYNDSANAYLWLGIALHRNGKLTESETALLQANKLSKNESSEVHWQLARLYSDQKRYKNAADELEQFLKNSSESAEAEKIKQMIAQLRQKASAQ